VNLIERLKKAIAASTALGVLRRDRIVILRNVSESGCLIESDQSIDAGVVGLLRIVVDGVEYSDLVRVARCESLAGGSRYQIGVEFVWTDAPGELALRRLIQQLGSEPEETMRRARFSAVPSDSVS